MNIEDLKFPAITDKILHNYTRRAQDQSSQFILWFLENVFRLDEQDAIDAVVDSHMDKGIDAIFSDNTSETVYIFQSKLNSKEKGTIPERDIKDFFASLEQFKDTIKIQALLDGNANQKLKDQLIREKVKENVEKGYSIQGVFCSNVPASADLITFMENINGIEMYDANKICAEYVNIDYDGGINSVFEFDVSGTDVIQYEPSGDVSSYIFLATALQLVNLPGISDGTLFERNVRLSLGNTKVNKGLMESIGEKSEHKFFPLYHNGINIICDSVERVDGKLSIKNFTVVNGAQSITSLHNKKSKLTNDLKIVVKVVALSKDLSLADRITNHSNNQNAIKARDLKANHGIQKRLKKEVEEIEGGRYFFEVKRQAKKEKDKEVIINEDVALYILATDLAQPFSCHQKYRVMDDLHGEIFGRPSLNGSRVAAIHEMGEISCSASEKIDNKPFSNYTLTKYYIAHLAWKLLGSESQGSELLRKLDVLRFDSKWPDFIKDFEILANTVALDLNAVYALEESEGRVFDYKTKMKSASWSNEITNEVITSYKKIVLRKQAERIANIAERYI